MSRTKDWLMRIEEAAYDASVNFDDYRQALAWFLNIHPSQKHIFDLIWFDCHEERIVDEY